MSETKCWSCNDPIGYGYWWNFGVTGVKKAAMRSHLCYPCTKSVFTLFGEKGKGAIKAAAHQQQQASALPGRGEGEA